MSKVALLNDSEIGLINPSRSTETVKSNPISKYNYVIMNYNSDYCLVDNIKLKSMRESFLYSLFYQILRNPFGAIFVVLALLVVPILNFLLYILILFALVTYFSALKVFRLNLEKNPDPFRNMIFSAEICESIRNINWGFDIAVSGFLF